MINSHISLILCILAILVLLGGGCATQKSSLTGAKEKIVKQPLIVNVAIERGIKEFDLQIQEGFIEHGVQKDPLPIQCKIRLTDSSVKVNESIYPSPVVVSSAAPILLNETPYYGRLRIENGLMVNEVPLEEYLIGVLSSEMYDNWPIEALKAQAVVSRTYVFLKILQNRNEFYHVDNSEIHQKFVYKMSSERIRSAVEHTGSLIILFEGKPIEAFFHASSGGITESCADVFQQDPPYLRSRPDPYSRDHTHVFWSLTISGEDIKRALKGIIDEKYETLRLNDIKLSNTTSSGRVSEFSLIFGENGIQVIRGNPFRLALDPKIFRSLLILDIQKEKKEGDILFTFSGLGYGHGVGMSQWGAMNMALQGFTFSDIVAFYFRGTKIGNYHMDPEGMGT